MKITESLEKVTYDKVNKDLTASAVEVVMDENFIKRNRHDWFWMGGNNVPNETGWYRVNRVSAQLEKIDTAEAAELNWHERLYIYGSSHVAIKDNLPLALYIGDEYEDGRLSALYLCGPDVLTRVALG
jgi:hypothetical protein